MKYEDPIIDFEKIDCSIYKEGFHGKARFSGSCPRVEPDRRGFRPSSITYDEELLTEQVFHEKSESSAASSRDTFGLPLGDIPLLLQTTLEDSERIREYIGHEVPRCANTDCRKELRGEKQGLLSQLQCILLQRLHAEGLSKDSNRRNT